MYICTGLFFNDIVCAAAPQSSVKKSKLTPGWNTVLLLVVITCVQKWGFFLQSTDAPSSDVKGFRSAPVQHCSKVKRSAKMEILNKLIKCNLEIWNMCRDLELGPVWKPSTCQSPKNYAENKEDFCPNKQKNSSSFTATVLCALSKSTFPLQSLMLTLT